MTVIAHCQLPTVDFFSSVTQVYKNLYQALVTSPDAFTRPHWWCEFAEKPVPGSRHSEIYHQKAKL